MFRPCRKRQQYCVHIQKLLDSGYREDEIENAKVKALQLDRTKILSPTTAPSTEEGEKQLIFTINHDRYMNKKIKDILSDCQNEINQLLGGNVRLIVAERRNLNIASSLFAKSAFSKMEVKIKENQVSAIRWGLQKLPTDEH